MEKEIFNTIGILDFNPDVWKLIVRILISALAGFAIGCERKYRLKDAGVKTHTIICITACLLMIISKYGFYELAKFDGISYDASRVASTIATGLCFIGSGMLLYKRENIKGLTAAVCMCLTMAIGMCFGAGLIVIGLVVTVLTIIIQLILYLPIPFFKNKYETMVRAQFYVGENYIEHFKEVFKVKSFIKFKTFKENDKLIAEVEFIYANKVHSEDLLKLIKNEKEILMFEKVEEN